MPEERSIVLYGAGEAGRECLHYFENDRRFIGFCSQTKREQEQEYLGYPVMSPEELLKRRDLTVFVSAVDARDEILQKLENGKYPAEQIFAPIPSYSNSVGDPGQYFSPPFMKYEDEEVFIDAGCYDFTTFLKLAEYCGRVKKVYAFEPDQDVYRLCVENSRKLPECHVEHGVKAQYCAFNKEV